MKKNETDGISSIKQNASVRNQLTTTSEESVTLDSQKEAEKNPSKVTSKDKNSSKYGNDIEEFEFGNLFEKVPY